MRGTRITAKHQFKIDPAGTGREEWRSIVDCLFRSGEKRVEHLFGAKAAAMAILVELRVQ